MSIKLVDTLESMGNFPVANADGIQFTDGESLQKKLDDGTLGSGNVGASYIELSQEEYDALGDDEKVNGSEYRTYDTGHIYKLGVEFGKETDISSKQDNLSQVKFTMRRNSASEGRYCLIGSSDLSQNLLMCEPYRFQGIFGDGATSVENKSIIDFMVSFREGVENPDEVLSGFANSSKGFEFVDLLITADETTNMAYAYVDFKTSGSVATGEITKPVLEAESYMDFAESFELTDTYIGTLVCKMSDYAKIITNIDDTQTSETSVWSSQKTSDEIAKHSLPIVFDSGIINNSSVQVYKLANVGYTASGGTDAYNLNLLLSSRGAEEIELIGGKNDGSWIIEAIRNNKSFNKMTNIYQDGLDIYVRLDLRCNYFRVYHKSGVLSDNFAVSLVDTVPESATEFDIRETATNTALATTNRRVQGATPFNEIYFADSRYRKLTVDLYYGREVTFSVNNLGYEGIISVYSSGSDTSACTVKNIGVRGNPQSNISVKWGNYKTLGGSGHYQVDLFVYKINANNTMVIRPRTQQIDGYSKIYTSADFVTSTQTEYEAAEYTATTEYESINDSSTGNAYSTWSSSKIASEIDNAILVKDIIYQGAITANQRKILGNVGIHVDKIISISKIFGDTVEGWDYGVAQMTNVGELVYMPTTTSESTFIQYKIAYRE